ncbi:MAG: hypothetical protein DI539_30645, partial [Flavobacterium psychrophilum]
VLNFYFSMGIPLYQGYGMNETCIITKNYPTKNKIGSVGPVFPNVVIKFDEEGQILVKNSFPVATSYLLCEKDERHVFMQEGYIATGDIGEMDEEGYLHITGRIKEMIALSNSKKIFPAAIETKIKSYPEIDYCIIYGDNRPYLSAMIVPSGKTIDRHVIQGILDEYNSNSKEEERIYRFFIVYDNLETLLTNQHKVRRQSIFEQYSSEFSKLYDS